MKMACCIEWLFQAEHEDFAGRIHASRDAGIDAVELHLWRDKPLDLIEQALDESNMRLRSFCIEPRRSLVDPAQHAEVLAAIADGIPVARRFSGAGMVIASGFSRPGVAFTEQQDAAVGVLKIAARMAADAGTVLLLEPVHMTVDGNPMFVQGVERGLDLVEAVDSDGLRLLCDVFHSAMSGEDLAEAIGTRMQWVGHVQVADTNGRHEPGTGGIDWPRVMDMLRDKGYDGDIGLEYLPSLPTAESLALTRRTLGL